MRDDAASNPLSFVVAGSLIIGVIGVALFATEEIGGPATISSGEAANRESQAQGLLSLMVDAPPDVAGADRLSLKQTGDESLNIVTFRKLQSTQFTTDTSNLLSYPHARDGLAVTDADFHIRSYPTLQSARDLLTSKRDESLEVVYIGHSEPKFAAGAAPTIDGLACGQSAADTTDTVRYTLDFTNEGTAETQFQAVLKIMQGQSGKSITVRDQSALVDAEQPGQITFDVPNTDDTKCTSATRIDVTLYGTSRKLAEKTFSATSTPPLSIGTVPGTILATGLPVFLRDLNYKEATDVTVEYNAPKNTYVKWSLYAGTDLTAAALQGPVSTGQNLDTFAFTAPGVDVVTEYTIKVQHSSNGATATQKLLVIPDDVTLNAYTETGSATVDLDPAFEKEVGMIDRLMGRFDPEIFDGTDFAGYDWPTPDNDWEAKPGDVYWDEKRVLTNSLPTRIKVTNIADCDRDTSDLNFRYDLYEYPDIIVVGSNVDHHAMTSGNFKLPLADWVYCGGLLIVFGSPDGTTQWLQPIFHVGDQQVTGGISAPDTTHPLLRIPNNLDFEAYDNKDRTWRYTSNAGDYFTNIVNQGSDPITAISDPGDFGKGTVLISNWLPYDLFGDGTGEDEGLYIMDNFLTQGYRDLFLDYGPSIPTDAPVVPAIRQSQIVLHSDRDEPNWHPACKPTPPDPGPVECHLDMTVLLYMF